MKDQVLNRIQIAELLSKEVLGELNDEEQEFLREWKSDKVNQDTYETIFNAKEYEARERMLANINLDNEWHNYLDYFNNNQKKPKGKTRSLWIWSSAAAVAVILVGLALVFKMEWGNNDLQTVQEASILPGKAKAELVLASGDIVQLNGASDNTIEDAGVKINSDEGQIAYNSDAQQVEEKVALNTLRIPRGGEYKLVLEDGTKVWLNSESELTYPVKFTGNFREVTLTGEAYFEVTHDETRPFYVKTLSQQVRVLGTSFNVNAYKSADFSATTLVEGSVEVTYVGTDENYQNAQILSPNEQFLYNTETHQSSVNKVDPYHYVSWKDGRIVLRNEPLGSFMEKLARWYDVKVVFEDEELKNIRFTGDLKRYNDLTGFLQILESEMTVKVKVKHNNIIYISK